MHTYEKNRASGSRGSKYTGLIAVLCLVVSMLATWALMRSSLGVIPTSTVTTAPVSSAPANR